jgi:hypothetical protein
VDPPHRNLHVGQPETPVPPKQSGIVDYGLAAAVKDIEHVVDKYRLVSGSARIRWSSSGHMLA